MSDARGPQPDDLFAFVGVLDTDGAWLSVDEARVVAAGFGIDDVRGQKCWDGLWWSDSDDLRQRLREACAQAARGEVARHEAVVRVSGDTRLTIAFQVAPLRDSAGLITHLSFSAVEVTGRVQADEALRRSAAEHGPCARKELLRAIIESTPDLIFAKDREGRMLAANSATLRAIRRTAEEVLGRSDVEFHDDRTQAVAIMQNDARIMERGVPETVEEVFTAPAGEARVFVSSKSPLRDAQGRVTGIVGVSRDITDQRRAERALRENEERLRLLIEHAPVALAMFDRQMRYLGASRRWLSDFGLHGRDLRGLVHYEVFPGGVPERWKDVHRRGLAGEVLRAEEELYTRLDGTVQWPRRGAGRPAQRG